VQTKLKYVICAQDVAGRAW